MKMGAGGQSLGPIRCRKYDMPTKPTGRSRGRPKGAKNVPKIEAFVAESLASRVPIPELKPKAAPRGPWARMTPEERSAHGKQLAASRTRPGGGRRPGVPRGMTTAEYQARKAAQTPLVDRIITKMIANGEIPDDPDVVEAFRQAGVILRSQDDPKTKLAAARLILDFKKAKPTTKIEHTVKTAEQYLDELAEDEF